MHPPSLQYLVPASVVLLPREKMADVYLMIRVHGTQDQNNQSLRIIQKYNNSMAYNVNSFESIHSSTDLLIKAIFKIDNKIPI